MIFNNNTTYLNNRFSADTNYTPGTGFADMLIESARNDLNMFKAMLNIDARELQMVNESDGYALVSLRESTFDGIVSKVKEVLRKFIEKLKGIFKNFIARVASLSKNDKKYVAKYRKLVENKDLSNCTFKWRKEKKKDKFNIDDLTKLPASVDLIKASDAYTIVSDENKDNSDATDKLLAGITGISSTDSSSFKKDLEESYYDDEDKTTAYKDIENISSICDYLSGYKDTESALNAAIRKQEANTKSIIRDLEKQRSSAADQHSADKEKEISLVAKNSDYALDIDKSDYENKSADAKNIYDTAVIYSQVITMHASALLQMMTIKRKMYKAALVKAVTYSPKTEAYATALSELAADEVEDVITSAIDSTDIDDINNASLNVMDSDVSNDPEKLLYDDPVHYRSKKTDGTVDSTIVGKNESAYFGSMFW